MNLFVYGSLQPGFRLFGYLEGKVAHVRPGTVAGRLYQAKQHNQFPYLQLVQAHRSAPVVKGTLMHVKPEYTKELIEQLDRIEGHPDHYERTLTLVLDQESQGLTYAWVYVAADKSRIGDEIISGEWV